ncbi:MAG: SUMF1/EgtB/PvdO family nonheme iron enzyme [Lentisphaerae bacterium]|nr:SUMF1/EgtB/PvdO family nonheme iron enzyme [Lentisphaerota bacterium]
MTIFILGWRSRGAAGGSNRVNRGGSWNNNANNCRSANRNRNWPSNRNNNLGFRLVSTIHGKDMNRPIRSARAPSLWRRNPTAVRRQVVPYCGINVAGRLFSRGNR